MKKPAARLSVLCLLLIVLVGAAIYFSRSGKQTSSPEIESAGNNTVVLWINVPGFRTDYLEKSDTPYFDSITGTFASRLTPQFPCLTFPSHATLATGRDVSGHGIPSDRFRLADGTVIDRPIDGSLLRAEPIWTTATRQRLGVLVHDWPLSQNQKGEHAAADFLTGYDAALTDDQRLEALYTAWSDHRDPTSLQLLMIRLNDLNLAGLRHGPTDGTTHEAVSQLDTRIGNFIARLTNDWKTLAKPEAKLVVVVSTDHGLAPMEKNINLVEILRPGVGTFFGVMEILSSRAVANIYFKNLPDDAAARAVIIGEIDRELETKLFFRTYTQQKLPPHWNYSTEGRIGDRVVVLKRGYSFSDFVAKDAVFNPAEADGHAGSFGYPVEEWSRMKGQLMIWSPNGTTPVADLDENDVTTLQLHPTVCDLLGIEAAEGVTAPSLVNQTAALVE